jgi:AcrR family transcriptional regulator
MSPRSDLPVPGNTRRAEPHRERADAARNRAKVLAAAQDLFAEHGAAQVTMEDVARRAGVGRATLYRRYTDVASIALALLDEHERQLQERLLRGEPPLGPGAHPADRLAAFYAAMLELLERHIHLALGAEVGRSRFGTEAYGFWRAHVHALLVEGGMPRATAKAMVDPLLAPLAPEVFEYQRHHRGLGVGQIRAALDTLAHAVLHRRTAKP